MKEPEEAPELVITDELKAQLQIALEESRKNEGAPYHYEESDKPTEMVTKFFGKIMQGTSFVSRIGTKGAEEYVEFLNSRGVLSEEVVRALARAEDWAKNHPAHGGTYMTGMLTEDVALVCKALREQVSRTTRLMYEGAASPLNADEIVFIERNLYDGMYTSEIEELREKYRATLR